MSNVPITLKEEHGIEHQGALFTLGVPFQRGALQSTRHLILKSAASNEQRPHQVACTSRWPDGSIRWVRLDFLADLAPHATDQYTLSEDSGADNTDSPWRLRQTEHDLVIEGPRGALKLHQSGLAWRQTTVESDTPTDYQVSLKGPDDHQATAHPHQPWHVKDNGPVLCRIANSGTWLDGAGNALVDYRCELTLLNEGTTLIVDVVTHNPRRALHPGGLWDLGDPGSVHIRSLTVSAHRTQTSGGWLKERPHSPALPLPANVTTGIYQDSSGGEHWHSQNHIDANGNSTTSFRGYRINEADRLVAEGHRASPIIALSDAHSPLMASMRRFWQEFPSSLNHREGTLTLGLFPEEYDGTFELQGGEQKAFTVFFAQSTRESALDWTQAPAIPVIPASCYESAQVIPWFRAQRTDDRLTTLINQGVDGPDNFFVKREHIDEYGWRHFGDLFADHESLYQPEGAPPLISHYNNQYDAIYGFVRQFALTGDRRWFELMDDLARHVRDIDVYRTNEDRTEYNHGLFWHTDHYLDAKTATHRTFSRLNDTSSTPGQTGGGPAAEHCYTTGLLLHGWMTGQCESVETSVALTKWMKHAHEGTGGLLEQVLAIKKQELPKFKQMLRGERPTSHRYPFTRGTGNYINSVLDAWLATGDDDWVTLAEKVIVATIHPNDDIEARDLLNVETGWHYLVLLTAIAKYLMLSAIMAHKSATVHYAQAALCHYARWMLEHERPFLSDPSQLEYPNDTWVAQDIRKAMVLFQAAWLDDEERKERYEREARRWLDNVATTLTASPERTFTRILVILMQNDGMDAGYRVALAESAEPSRGYGTPALSWPALVARVVARLARGARHFHPAKEKAWLALRLDR